MEGFDHLSGPPVFRVALENIWPLWRQVEPLLEPLIAMRPTHTVEDVRRMLMGQQCHLWVKMNGPLLESFTITEFNAFPQGVWLHAWLAAAKDEERFDYGHFKDVLSEWAKANGCRGVSATGRRGWMRKYPEAALEGVVMRATWNG